MVDDDVYRPGRFSDIAKTATGRDLWKFLNTPQTVHAMEIASELGQPAVAAIGEAALKMFGETMLDDRIKQVTGHMVRQVLERRGFVVDQSDVKINTVPFSKGTRYRRPEWFTVHVFRNSKDARDLCLTDRRDVEGLPVPADDGRWRYWTTFSSSLRASIGFGVRLDEIKELIHSRGFVRHRLLRVLSRS